MNIKGKMINTKVWKIGECFVIWNNDKQTGGQWGFCYAPGMVFNVFMGSRTLSFQWGHFAKMYEEGE